MMPKILIIEDSPDVAHLLEILLKPRGFVIESASDGLLGWQQLEKFNPDLILLDIMLPEMSGIELCKKIKSDSRFTNTKILILSAKDSQADRLAGLAIGADDYITKPFHGASLVRKIEFILENKL